MALTTEYLNLPITPGIAPTGFWYYYTPATANNTSKLASITPYRWGDQLPLEIGGSNLIMQGSFPLITESWDGANTLYHGGCIEWVGSGVNNITAEEEGDAFFFSHLGTLSTSPNDDVFYWDRAFVPIGGTEWKYYQYHAHSPTSYVQYENGRQVQGGDGFIDPADKAYGYMISTQVRVAGVFYNSVIARIHTPSVGGAHNSHNDITLPAVSNRNYMPGGILRGIGERYHTFYITAVDSQWRVFSRTYTDAAGSFTAEVDLGVYDLATPNFNRSLGQQSQYPVRASNGTSFGARIYFPVIMNNSTSGFDLEIWSFNSLDTVSSGTLNREVLVSGVTARPDAFCAVVGTQTLYVLLTDVANGGVRLWKFDGSIFTDVGIAISNDVTEPLRVHGFEFNSEDFKFYALLSGTAAGDKDYLGPGLYTFELDETFEGYKHLDYDAVNNAFVERGPLSAGFLRYTQINASFARINAVEPQAIGSGINIMDYAPPGPGTQFFNRKSVGFGGKDFYYHSITLQDGRRVAAGQVVDNPENLGIGGDLLFSIYSSDLKEATHLASGGPGADFFTGVYQSSNGQRIWLTGYSKSELVPKGEIWVHGWARNISDGGNAMEWKDLSVDSDGNVYLVGSHNDGWTVLAKYDKNYVLQWQRQVGDGTNNTDIGVSINIDDQGDIYVSGSTEEYSEDDPDALLIKVSPEGDLIYARVYGTASSDLATSVVVIKKNGTQYLVMSVVTGTTTTFLVTDLLGNIVEQNIVADLVINRLRYNQTDPDSGRFLFAGNDGAGTKVGKFGMGEILSPTRAVQWISSYSATANVNLNDIVNSDLDKYVICGDSGHDGMLAQVAASETGPGSWMVTADWAKEMEVNPEDVHPCNCGFNSLCVATDTEDEIYIYVVGSARGNVIPEMGEDEGLITRWKSNGDLDWQNVFGHDMHESFAAVVNDTTGRNIITAGWSESHSSSRDAVFFRAENLGFGTGLYTPDETSAMPYYYVAADYTVSANTNTYQQLTAPSNSSGTLVGDSYEASIDESFYSAQDYNGAFGPNGVFSLFLAYVDLDLLQSWLNSDTYRENLRRGVKLNYIDDWNLIGKIWQVGTVGDGSADDGNAFGYDIIEATSGLVYVIGQTSGDIEKTNTGTSGVYDYLLVALDPDTEELEFYQNGTDRDEETYALTELEDGRIAFTGRTSGDLGEENFGGYDVFLGIYNPTDDTFDYYSIGSGLDDTGVNVHDLGNNELAVVFFTYGALTEETENRGSQDIGVIKFNYDTDTWGTAYQTGSTTSELFEQNGKPSALLSNGRIAVTASSTGIFADDAVTYGFLDVCLAILDLETGEWTKFQVGTTANEISSSASVFGDTILIGGNAGGSFDEDIDAIFVEFDASDAFVGKSTSVT